MCQMSRERIVLGIENISQIPIAFYPRFSFAKSPDSYFRTTNRRVRKYSYGEIQDHFLFVLSSSINLYLNSIILLAEFVFCAAKGEV